MGRGSQYSGSSCHVVYPKVNSAKFGVPPVPRFTLLSRRSFPFACGTGVILFLQSILYSERWDRMIMNDI